MASLISAAEKAVYSSAIDDLHDTHSRDILVIQEVANVDLSNVDENYNPYSDKKDPKVTYSSINTTISARIKFLDKADNESLLMFAGGGGDGSNGTSIPLNQSYGLVRIKVNKIYHDLVNSSSKIIVDGVDCQLFNASTPISLFDINYITFYLVRQN